jgi:hypothetical protein
MSVKRIHGLSISLFYEKKTYKFVLFTSSSTPVIAGTTSKSSTTTILLAKSSPSVLKRFFAYLDHTFSISQPSPLKLPSSALQQTLQNYIITVLPLLDSDLATSQQEDALTSILGTVKVTLSFSAPVAPHLKTLDISIPANTVLAMCKKAHNDKDVDRGPPGQYCLDYLACQIHAKTGLKLPLSGNDNDRELRSIESSKESPIKISRISTASYALSSDSRLKLASKPLDAFASSHDRDDDDGNSKRIVSAANLNLLNAVLKEAQRQVREDG